MIKRCFKQGCELEVQYVCLCMNSETCCCEIHLQKHLKLPYRTHSFDSIFVKPLGWDKAEIIEVLVKEKSKKEKLKKIASFSKDYQKSLDFDLKEINSLIEKISQFSKKDEGLYSNQLILQPDQDAEAIERFSKDPDPCNSAKLFFEMRHLKNERSLILNRTNNDPKTEQNFRQACLLYENNTSDLLLSQAYKEYVNYYQNITSTFLIGTNKDRKAIDLFVYDTESEREEIKVREIQIILNPLKSIIHIPNCELFAYGTYGFIIDKNYQFREFSHELPLGCLTAIYYNRSIYCFGDNNYPRSSRRFNLDENSWSLLASMPEENYNDSNNIIFNGNILISWKNKVNILLYSIDIDSFSKIPYDFGKGELKLLINAEERLYLVECGYNAWIYESEIGNEYSWTKLSISIIDYIPKQAYSSYNKGAIYISILDGKRIREYLKFDLCKKTLTEIACYSDNIALKRNENKLEAIECYGHTFQLNPDHAEIYINKGLTLSYIVNALEIIESKSQSIENNSKDWLAYVHKGSHLYDLGNYPEAIDCYNEAIKFQPKNLDICNRKGNSLYKLKKYSEAIECYNESIKIMPKIPVFYFWKGKALYKINRIIEAIECFNEAINRDSNNYLYFWYRAIILNDLGREEEAVNDFLKAYDLILCASHNGNIGNKLAYMLWKLQEKAVEFKAKLQLFKNTSLNNPEILSEIEKKEAAIKEQHSQLLKKAIKGLSVKYRSRIARKEKIKEIIELQDAMAEIVAQLNYF